MSEQSDLLKDARKASIKSLVEQLRVVYRLKQGSTPDCGSTPPTCPPPTSSGSDLSGAGDLIFDLARLHLNTYNQLLDLSSRHTDRFINGLRSLLLGKHGPSVPCVGPVLEMSGPATKCARKSFQVVNRLPAKAEVTFLMSEFRPAAGGAPFSAHVTFTADQPAPPPADRCLGPSETRTFTLEISLAPPFAAGQRYAATLHVSTAGRLTEALPVRVEVTGK
jgi:hypothetical protein